MCVYVRCALCAAGYRLEIDNFLQGRAGPFAINLWAKVLPSAPVTSAPGSAAGNTSTSPLFGYLVSQSSVDLSTTAQPFGPNQVGWVHTRCGQRHDARTLVSPRTMANFAARVRLEHMRGVAYVPGSCVRLLYGCTACAYPCRSSCTSLLPVVPCPVWCAHSSRTVMTESTVCTWTVTGWWEIT